MRAEQRRRWVRAPRAQLIVGLFTGILVVALGASHPNEPTAPHGPPSDRSVEHWQKTWSDVLARHVDAQGRVDFSGLGNDRAGLDDVVRFIAAVDPMSSPDLFPTQNSRLAYYIDAYNALAMYGVLDAGVPKRFGLLGRIRFFVLRKFVIGGRTLSLYRFENNVIRPLGDPRVHFALNCMSVSCPRLPQSAFTADALDQELDAAAREFVAEQRNVTVDSERREVRISAIFKFYTQDFLAQSPDLLSYINRYRSAPIPTNYKVVFADYDWSINDQRAREKN
ncbi:MAG: DUF547 domain-containing protein [Proteobacteria bacterium]|nr:DUF547 domain-containing protein [Pseudomonadota bacterium]